MPLAIGQVLHERYRIARLLGQGGFGAVYRAWDTVLERPWALKESLHTAPDVQRQFLREARILANLEHPNLPRVVDFFNIEGQGQYLVMDFVGGENLQELFENQGGKLPVAQVLGWIDQVCQALIYLHSQSPPVIHRDIKPANIKVTPEGRVKLVDFGIAKLYDTAVLTTAGARAVTPGFSPPEQYGMGGTDVRSDIYALAATLYFLLTGVLPPESVEIMSGGAPPPLPAHQINSQINPAVSAAIARAMRLNRNERFASVAEFRAAVGVGEQTPPAPVPTRQPAVATVSQAPPAPPLTATMVAPAVSEINLTLAPGVELFLVRVPAGEFLMGSADTDKKAYDDEKPQHRLPLDDFWIGKYPVTNLQYQAFVLGSGHRPPGYWGRGVSPQGKEQHPVAEVNWKDALAFCQWASQQLQSQGWLVRLPSEAEWEKAARGVDGRIWPWGNQPPGKQHANFGHVFGGATPVGGYSPQGDSPYGCADMAGNVWEWTRSLYKKYPYDPADGREDLAAPGARVVRGGSWDNIRDDCRCASRDGGDPLSFDSDLGFRVVLSPV